MVRAKPKFRLHERFNVDLRAIVFSSKVRSHFFNSNFFNESLFRDLKRLSLASIKHNFRNHKARMDCPNLIFLISHNFNQLSFVILRTRLTENVLSTLKQKIFSRKANTAPQLDQDPPFDLPIAVHLYTTQTFPSKNNHFLINKD